MTTHNKTKTREYNAWLRMRKSCLSPNYPSFKTYGAKGVTICEEWVKDFPKFLEDMGTIPENCNGLELIDSQYPFCKLNCRWIFKTAGRKDLEKKSAKVNRKTYRIKNPKRICLVLEQDHYDFIVRQAIAKSSKEGFIVEPNEIIREALQKAFPAPKQFDMFGDSKKKPS